MSKKCRLTVYLPIEECDRMRDYAYYTRSKLAWACEDMLRRGLDAYENHYGRIPPREEELRPGRPMKNTAPSAGKKPGRPPLWMNAK